MKDNSKKKAGYVKPQIFHMVISMEESIATTSITSVTVSGHDQSYTALNEDVKTAVKKDKI
ncbi:hypothetical protein J5U18_03115 [Sphingobacteriaceae bacterium WQ 2009]|uniref:Uncharacterized protein n=1 Tax=Rhinopithecimicrobium faecis TaxID=2820698 RepID=A0A8T4H869_9SPHI|nr:hypothetical protein [Sphingobacteriaceae bacterium WQ 2009]